MCRKMKPEISAFVSGFLVMNKIALGFVHFEPVSFPHARSCFSYLGNFQNQWNFVMFSDLDRVWTWTSSWPGQGTGSTAGIGT